LLHIGRCVEQRRRASCPLGERPEGRFAATTLPDFRELASPAIRRKSCDSLLRKSKVAEQFVASIPIIAREANPNIVNSGSLWERPRKKFPRNFTTGVADHRTGNGRP
jgi:hypothetical protein